MLQCAAELLPEVTVAAKPPVLQCHDQQPGEGQCHQLPRRHQRCDLAARRDLLPRNEKPTGGTERGELQRCLAPTWFQPKSEGFWTTWWSHIFVFFVAYDAFRRLFLGKSKIYNVPKIQSNPKIFVIVFVHSQHVHFLGPDQCLREVPRLGVGPQLRCGSDDFGERGDLQCFDQRRALEDGPAVPHLAKDGVSQVSWLGLEKSESWSTMCIDLDIFEVKFMCVTFFCFKYEIIPCEVEEISRHFSNFGDLQRSHDFFGTWPLAKCAPAAGYAAIIFTSAQRHQLHRAAVDRLRNGPMVVGAGPFVSDDWPKSFTQPVNLQCSVAVLWESFTVANCLVDLLPIARSRRGELHRSHRLVFEGIQVARCPVGRSGGEGVDGHENRHSVGGGATAMMTACLVKSWTVSQSVICLGLSKTAGIFFKFSMFVFSKS